MKEPQRTHRLLDVFPPPRFLVMTAAGLDVSDEMIRFAELRRRGMDLHLYSYGEERIPKGVIEEGLIKDKGALVAILSNLQRKYGLRFVKASLPEEQSYIFKTDLPWMDERDIRGALQFKIEENVPISVNDAVFDYRIMRNSKPTEKNMHVSVTVMSRKVVESYTEVFKEARLYPIVLRVESHSIVRAAIPEGTLGTYILITVREAKTILAIVSDGEVEFTSTIHIGGETIAASIQKNLSVDGSGAERIRKGKEMRESNEMFLSLVSAGTVLRDEVQKLITYWDGHSQDHGHGPEIKGIIISGSDALLGLDDYLSRSLDLEVRTANPWSNIVSLDSYIPSLTRRESLDYLPALGLALPYE